MDNMEVNKLQKNSDPQTTFFPSTTSNKEQDLHCGINKISNFGRCELSC